MCIDSVLDTLKEVLDTFEVFRINNFGSLCKKVTASVDKKLATKKHIAIENKNR